MAGSELLFEAREFTSTQRQQVNPRRLQSHLLALLAGAAYRRCVLVFPAARQVKLLVGGAEPASSGRPESKTLRPPVQLEL